MNKLKAVFWDVDGTLADTEMCGHRLAFNLAFKDFDLDYAVIGSSKESNILNNLKMLKKNA